MGCTLQSVQALSPCPPRAYPLAAASDNNEDRGSSTSGVSTTNEKQPWWKEVGAKLRATGSAGLLAYGILNAAYYSLAVALLWIYTGGGTRGLAAAGDTAAMAAVVSTGVKATAQRFVKVLALAWAGSQVTKPFRVGGAVLLAPVAGRLMDWVQARLGLKRRGDTVPIIIVALLLITGGVFGSLILQGTVSDALSHAATAGRPLAFLGAPRPPLPFMPLLGAAAATMSLSSPATGAPVAAAAAAATTATRAAGQEVELNRHGKPKRRPKRQYLPPNPNVHGWDQHPAYLRGRWNVTTLAFRDEGAAGTMRAVVEGGLKALVLKRDALALLRDGVGNLTAKGWEFTPANRRLVVEVALPGEYDHAVLRLSGEVRRKPKHWCRATGSVRLRPAGSGKYQPHRALPSSDPAWPIVGQFVLERDMAPPPQPSKLERILVWLRLEAPRFSNTKAGRRAKAYLGLDDDEENGQGAEGKEEEREWNARALKFEMWKYFK